MRVARKWEAIVMFHASGDGLDIERIVAKQGPGAMGYRKGEPASGGRKHSLSGFKMDLGEANSAQQLEEKVLKHVEEQAEVYAEVAKQGGQVSVGIGLMVSGKEPLTVTLTPKTLGLLASAGITVHVTGYPVMDLEDEETGEPR